MLHRGRKIGGLEGKPTTDFRTNIVLIEFGNARSYGGIYHQRK